MGEERDRRKAVIRAIYIVVEGDTEEEFVNSLLQPHFASIHRFYDVRAIKLATSSGHKGGDLSFARYQHNVALLLNQESDVVVTSLIDFYQLRTDFPSYNEAKKQNRPEDQVAMLENACNSTMNNDRFIPYIQLHEFEALVFSARRGFDQLGLSARQLAEINKILTQFPNPELINEGQQTAPSKRLAAIIPGYQKVLYGNMIALENGFQTILSKCPRFNAWIKLLESKIQRDG